MTSKISFVVSALIFSLNLGVSLNANAHTHAAPIKVGTWVIDPAKKHLKALARYPELVIDHVTKVGYEVYGPLGLDRFLSKNHIHFVMLPRIPEKNLADYPTPETIIKKQQDLQKKFPQLITLIEIGKSVQGRPLLFARLTAPASRGARLAERPEFKYVANMHGDEIVGRELMIRLIEDLATNYGKDNRVTRLLDSVQIYILPSMNPDGAAVRARANARGIDLNRSFPDFTTSDNQNTIQNREPEIQAMMKFQAAHRFKLSANFHGGAEVVNYPWDTTAAVHPLDNFIQTLSLDYSKRVPYMYNSNEFKRGITNGFAWYEVNGGMQDWSFQWHKDLQVTIELTRIKWPSYNTVDQSYQLNRDALIAFIENIAKVQ